MIFLPWVGWSCCMCVVVKVYTGCQAAVAFSPSLTRSTYTSVSSYTSWMNIRFWFRKFWGHMDMWEETHEVNTHGERENESGQGKIENRGTKMERWSSGIVAVTTICLAFVWDYYFFASIAYLSSFNFVLLFFPNMNLLCFTPAILKNPSV